MSQRIVEEVYTKRITIPAGSNGLISDVTNTFPKNFEYVVGVAAYQVSSADEDYAFGITKGDNTRVIDITTSKDWVDHAGIPRSERFRRPMKWTTGEASSEWNLKMNVRTALTADLVLDLVFELSNTDNGCEY